MDLDAWFTAQGKGSREALHRVTGLSLPAIDRARERRATLETAEKIHLATGRQVELGHMTAARELPPPPRAVRRRGKRASA